MNYRVLITTSGLGLRLGDFTKYTNKSLIRIKERPVISYIVENYPKSTEFVVTLGYYGNHIKQFLEIAYPERKFIFVRVAKYQGKGSSLLSSMLKARKFLQMPFIFHACDTLVFEKIPPPNRNWSGGFKGIDSANYRSFDVVDDFIEKFYDKGVISPDFLHIGLVGIFDYKIFWEEASQLYNKNKNDQSLSDVQIIDRMIKNGERFYAVEFKEWHDTGNVRSLFETWSKFSDLTRTMDKPGAATFFVNSHVIKFFWDENRLEQRVKRAELLKGFVPKISTYSKNFLKYRYIKGNLLSRSILPKDFLKFLEWLQNEFWKNAEIENKDKFVSDCKRFYFDKTVERTNIFFNDLNMVDTEDFINGTKVPKLSKILSRVDFDYLSNGIPSRFHGDLILDNAIEKGNKFVLLDWRENFSGNLGVGDRYYDLAKLNHNLCINHEVVNKELFTIKVEGSKVFCDILRHNRLIECQNIFYKFVDRYDYDLRKIKILTSLIWLNMSPLHQHPFDLFLFYFGKYNLWRAINEEI